jgi:hypothetical protein
MAYGEMRRTQASARMLPSTGSIAGGTLGLRFRADGKLLVVPAFNRPLVDTGEVRWWMAKCVVHRSGRHLIDSGGRLPGRSVGRITAFGSARTDGLPQELCGPASHLSFHLRASVRRHRSSLERRIRRALTEQFRISWAISPEKKRPGDVNSPLGHRWGASPGVHFVESPSPQSADRDIRARAGRLSRAFAGGASGAGPRRGR